MVEDRARIPVRQLWKSRSQLLLQFGIVTLYCRISDHDQLRDVQGQLQHLLETLKIKAFDTHTESACAL